MCDGLRSLSKEIDMNLKSMITKSIGFVMVFYNAKKLGSLLQNVQKLGLNELT